MSQVSNESSIRGALECLNKASDGNDSARSHGGSENQNQAEVDYSARVMISEEDLVPEDESISELSQTFLIEQTQTKMHITERTYEDSFDS
mmetsp:Transcript_21424/g.28747  ORF Transcript_21424/g.28747 Transcript_21424/m.28747 type:complete len:91 (+) Transcript_21424:567-839(+)|eukprot:CAMPEP_0185597510 /NCGR_PEP_ID=MMETSP0434-20130131/81414_1 /TAXON_ID=626734 ORGANISM="Favella taraikaensis, Strain Fe Narragansett Bay" /NCGR_SAMPLE_ID=MMETSP0434 /ASSEMBLY_ACC=CAM_ASM_000379 /LENGTH=90 /DNA_ID=CAMNT_0028226255 /DNA_START=1333 /DNA_END=1605 /DNA_ORIENTATION=-